MSDTEKRIAALEAEVARLKGAFVPTPTAKPQIKTNAQKTSRTQRQQITKTGSKPGITWPLQQRAAQQAAAATQPAVKRIVARPATKHIKVGPSFVPKKLTPYINGPTGREATGRDEPELATVLSDSARGNE